MAAIPTLLEEPSSSATSEGVSDTNPSSSSASLSLSKKRKMTYTDDDVPGIMDFLEGSLDREDKKMFKRVKHYVRSLENKNAQLEAQQKSLTTGNFELPASSKPLIDKYAGNFTRRNQGQESLEWMLKLIVKESTIRFDHKEKDTKLSKVAFYERKDSFLERSFNKVDKVLEAVMKKKKIRAIATIKGHDKPDLDIV